MVRQSLQRIVSLCVTLAVSSIVVFGSLYAAPGNPIDFLLGHRTVSPQAIQAIRHQYALDLPFYERFYDWVANILRGDFGQSIIHHQSVMSLIAPRVETTAILIIYAAAIIIIVGVALGVLAAVRSRRTDTTVLFVTIAFISIPPFVAGVTLIIIFSVGLGWFPVFGAGDGLINQIYHLTLPAIALSLMSTAYVARVTRTSLKTELKNEHVQTAIGRGIPWPTVVRRHVFRNSLLQVTTVIGLSLVSLLSTSVVIEGVFGLGGLGSLLVDSVQNRDFAVVQAICLLYVATVVVISTIVDLGYAVLDPRIRTRG